MGQFSTRTYIYDLQSGKIVLDLSKLDVIRAGQTFRAVDFNFWGVTFSHDGHTFYATLGTGGMTYLIRADLDTRRAVVLRSGVECPSLSPDGTRIAFKSRNPGRTATWRISVLDLATLKSHPLAETRDVDDQPAWLNDRTVMYGLVQNAYAQYGASAAAMINSTIATDTWTVPADGSGGPRLLIPGAWSSVVASP
jgi:Tol biopolymer transport system component